MTLNKIVGKYNINYMIDNESSLDIHILEAGVLRDWALEENGIYWLSKLIEKDSIILDIGANVGYYCLVWSKILNPLGKIFAFEPDPEMFFLLSKNIEQNPGANIECIPMAIQDDPDKLTINFNIYRTPAEPGTLNKGLSSIENQNRFIGETISINCTTCDKFIENKNINKVSLIKIDVEGSEFKVLSGARLLIERDKPIIIYEHCKILDEFCNNLNTVNSFLFLKDRGYSFILIKDKNSIIEVDDTSCVDYAANIIAYVK
jgi:FkbM family methyltransferase